MRNALALLVIAGGCVLLARLAVFQTGAGDLRERLSSAILQGDVEQAEQLLRQGAPANGQDEGCVDSPLIAAVVNGHERLVHVLIDNGADVNARNRAGFTALIYAAFGGKHAIAAELICAGADVNACSLKGCCALRTAVQNGDLAMIELLLNAKANCGRPGGRHELPRLGPR